MGLSLDYKGIEFSISKNFYHKIESKNDISIHVSGYENKHLFPTYFSKNCLKVSLKYC